MLQHVGEDTLVAIRKQGVHDGFCRLVVEDCDTLPPDFDTKKFTLKQSLGLQKLTVARNQAWASHLREAELQKVPELFRVCATVKVPNKRVTLRAITVERVL